MCARRVLLEAVFDDMSGCGRNSARKHSVWIYSGWLVHGRTKTQTRWTCPQTSSIVSVWWGRWFIELGQ